jgi:hypothetical protein
MQLSISGINMMPKIQANVSENKNADEKLDLLQNV